ncbi:MAG: hypothetical protein NT051_01450 [Candidatus Micrarchaeota archaeon]|nr:hypothetical protein [Candidatus Micrarchaeota archaeon]
MLVEQLDTASEDHAQYSKKLLAAKSHAIENNKLKLNTLLNRQNDAVRVAQMKLGEIKQKNEQIAKVKRELGMIA